MEAWDNDGESIDNLLTYGGHHVPNQFRLVTAIAKTVNEN